MKSNRLLPAAKRLFAPTSVAALLAIAPNLQAQTATWTTAGGGTWSDTANWSGGTVADSGSNADFTTVDLPAGANTVTLDSNRSVGALSFGDTDTGTAGTWAIAGTSTLTVGGSVNAAVATTIAPIVAGSGGLTKSGAGSVTLSGANTFTGALAVNAGNLTLSNTNAYAGGTTIATGGTVTLGRNANFTSGGLGTGTITFTGGQLTSTFSGSNTVVVSELTDIASGQTGTFNATARFEYTGAVQGGGTYNINYNTTVARADFRNNFAAFTGTLNLTGTGTARLRINQTAPAFNRQGLASTTLNVGPNAQVQAVTNSEGNANNNILVGALSGSGSFLAGTAGSPRYHVGALGSDTTFAGSFQGNSWIVKQGTGSLTLTGNNTNTGAVNITDGTLRIGDGAATGNLGTGTVTLSGTGVLDLNRSDAHTVSNVIAGTGAVRHSGSGTGTLSGANTFTGNIEMLAGSLRITDNTNLGNVANSLNFPSGSGRLLADGTLAINRAANIGLGATGGLAAADAGDELNLTGVVSGDGDLAISGNGVVILGADNTYLGNTTITSGSLVAANVSGSATSAGSVSVNGGVLGGDGSVTGSVTVAAGGGLKPGNLTGAISEVGSLDTGSLTLAGGSTIYAEFENASSYDQVIATGLATSGASVGNPVIVDLRAENSPAKWTTLGTYNLIQYGGSFSGNANDLFEVSAGSQQAGLSYTFAASGGFITLTIAGAAPSQWNVDASGNWSSAANWINGVPNAVDAPAVFGSIITAPRVVTLDGAKTAGSLVFNNANAYTLAGDTLNLNVSSGNVSIDVLDGNHTISAPVGLADNTTLALATSGESLAFTGTISGAGGLSKTSPGNVDLQGSNTFTGDITFSQGSLSFSNGGLGAGSNLSLSSTTLVWNSLNTEDVSSRNVALVSGDVAFDTGANNVTLANAVGNAGAGKLVKSGSGNLILAADATHTGGTTVSAGTLVLGDGGITGSVIGDILNNSTLAVNLAGGESLPNLITGTGNLDHAGSGILNLTAANTFSGLTTVATPGATLVLGNTLALQNSTLNTSSTGGTLGFGTLTAATLGGLSGNGSITLENDALAAVALTVGNNGAATTFSGGLSGAGSLVKTGAGILTIDGANTYTGVTTVSGGGLTFATGGSANCGATTINGTGSILVEGGDYSTASITLATTAPQRVFRMAFGTTTVAGTIAANASNGSSSSGLILIEGGDLVANSINLGRSFLNFSAEPTNTGTDNVNYIQTGGNATISGDFNIGTVAQANSSVISRVEGGTLTVNGAMVITLNNGGRWSAFDLNGGELNLPNTSTGLLLGGANAGNAAFLARFGLATIARVQFGQAGNGTGVFSLSGAEVYIGSGGMVQGPNPSFVPSIKLNSGTLGAAQTWSTSLGVVLGGAVTIKAADFSTAPNDITISGVVSGNGTIVKTGGGTLSLTAANTYTGNTSVEEGTLTLANAYLSNDHELSVAAGATLNLTHAANDIVGSFVIDSVVQPSGVYGAVGSGAQYETSAITGTGRIVVPGADPYADWASGFGLAGGDADKGADPDNDGRINLLEFATNDNPTSPSASGKVRARVENVSGSDVLVITLPVRDGATFSGVTAQEATIDNLTYSIEGSDDVDDWNLVISEVTPALTANPALPALDAGWTYRTFRTPGSVDIDPEDFIRLKVTAP